MGVDFDELLSFIERAKDHLDTLDDERSEQLSTDADRLLTDAGWK